MRPGIALFAVLVAAFVITAEQSSHGQIVANPSHENFSGVSCSPSGAPGQPVSSPEVSISGVSFFGALTIPVADQSDIAESIKRETHGSSVDRVTDEALERARAGWQNRGYFKVEVHGQGRWVSSTGNQGIALFVNVEEGPQYRLSGITFSNNRAISNTEALRRLFPIEDGEVFSREKIGRGLENLRHAYLQYGYINFTSMPDTSFDDERGTIFLKIDIDEGKQFYVRSIEVWGLDESAWREMLKYISVGQAYNARLLDVFLKSHSLDFSSG